MKRLHDIFQAIGELFDFLRPADFSGWLTRRDHWTETGELLRDKTNTIPREPEYRIVLEESSTGFSAYCPELDGVIAAGETREETIELMKESVKFHLEGLQLQKEGRL